jgi:hypothetical protein
VPLTGWDTMQKLSHTRANASRKVQVQTSSEPTWAGLNVTKNWIPPSLGWVHVS